MSGIDATSIILALSPWIGVLSSVGIFIWRSSALNSQVKENTKDLNNLGDKVRQTEKELRDNYKETTNKFQDMMNENAAMMSNIQATIVRLETKFDYLIDKK